jgi:uncharacterized protein
MDLSFTAGLLLGLASSLHCAVMCGGISSGLLFAFDTNGTYSRARVLLLAQAGRISAYIALGAAFGALGSQIYPHLSSAEAYRLLQWAGAAALMWVGLSTAGLVPAVSGLDRLLSPVSNFIARKATRFTRWPLAPFLVGTAWGLMPCAMVYAALFTAALSGSATGGVTIMAGFGIGTLPAVMVTAFGIRSLIAADSRPILRSTIGIAIAVFGILTVYAGHPIAAPICE